MTSQGPHGEENENETKDVYFYEFEQFIDGKKRKLGTRGNVRGGLLLRLVPIKVNMT